ncbi:type II CAAX endopeptidase family protein [Paenibacillus methanolicus]|uniref:CAAX prenyl protease-like protein n=1 Tax=Paenibacillus methanolicus TaxID=582686 RepID=A0A5S5CK82_9BACL|nr:CPBP family intramembrane glutamic endopeptidase [Paenibacillus methanolicus]TYP79317.1 CAAX prenyl protease-like protein [Paenibacillus methanolicus]
MTTKWLAIGRSLLNAAVYLVAFFAIYTLHETLIIQSFTPYREFMHRNIPVFLSFVMGIVFIVFLIISRVHTAITGGKRPGIIRNARFTALNASQWLQVAIIGLGGTMLYLSLMNLHFIRNNTQDFENYVHTFGQADHFLYVLAGVGFLAVCFEELLFRGIVFNALKSNMPVWVSTLLSSVIYGYFQPNIWVSVTAFFLSILYCLVYYRMRSLWSTIGIGAIINCLIMIADRVGLVDGMAKLPTFVLEVSGFTGLLLIVGTLLYMWKGGAFVKPYAVMVGNLAVYVGIYYALLQTLVVIWEQAVLPKYPALGNHGIIGLFANALLAMPLYYVVLKRFYKKDLIAIAEFKKTTLSAQALSMLLAVCMGLWIMSLFTIPQVAKAAPGFDGIVGFFLRQEPWVFFSFFVINSLYKEVLFRALIFNELRRAVPLPAAMAVTGILYGILFFSGDIPLMLYGTAGAVIFGLLYVWHRSIWLTIVNEYVLFASYYIIWNSGGLPDGGVRYVIMALSSAGVLGLMYALWRMSRPASVTRRQERRKVGIGA